MRTTLDLDDVALDAIRDLAAVQKQSIGKVAGNLILEALRSRSSLSIGVRNGIPLMPRSGGEVVTEEMIQRIREEEGV
jgi:hypothetical protein